MRSRSQTLAKRPTVTLGWRARQWFWKHLTHSPHREPGLTAGRVQQGGSDVLLGIDAGLVRAGGAEDGVVDGEQPLVQSHHLPGETRRGTLRRAKDTNSSSQSTHGIGGIAAGFQGGPGDGTDPRPMARLDQPADRCGVCYPAWSRASITYI